MFLFFLNERFMKNIRTYKTLYFICFSWLHYKKDLDASLKLPPKKKNPNPAVKMDMQ